MAKARRLMVSDDDELVREAYRSFFANRRDFEIVAETADGAQAVAVYPTAQPDVVLMDLQMPRMNGVQATAEITRLWPDACIVMLTTFGSREHIVPALRAGAAGYLLKDSGPEALINGINQALAGIGQKLGVSSRTQILVRAIQLGLVDPRRLPPLA